MTRRMGFIALLGLFALPLVTCQPDAERSVPDAEAAGAPDTERPMATPYRDWDANRDMVLQRDEFALWRTDQDAFARWVGDDGMNREIFADRIYVAWDTDGDGVVTEQEWVVGVEPVLEQPGSWSDWDPDGDSELDLNEVAEALETQGTYDLIDRDQDRIIDDEEIADFFYDLIDLNDNGELDVTEWDAFSDSWLDDEGALR